MLVLTFLFIELCFSVVCASALFVIDQALPLNYCKPLKSFPCLLADFLFQSFVSSFSVTVGSSMPPLTAIGISRFIRFANSRAENESVKKLTSNCILEFEWHCSVEAAICGQSAIRSSLFSSRFDVDINGRGWR